MKAVTLHINVIVIPIICVPGVCVSCISLILFIKHLLRGKRSVTGSRSLHILLTGISCNSRDSK